MAFGPERRKPGDYGDMKGITQDEVSRLQKAMKQKEFRDHIEEYTREVSDPAHRQEYLDYLAQIEAKGEMPDGQQLLRCNPGLCVKTNISFKSGQKQKCFINIVHTDRLDDLTLLPAEGGQGGHQVHLPYSLSPPRPDRDLKDEYCMTCDFAVSTGTFQRASQSSQILKLLIDTATDGMSQQFLKGHQEVSKDYKVMQRLQCKGGQPLPMSVRAELLKKGAQTQAPAPIPDRDAITPSELKEMRQAAAKKKKLCEAPAAAEEEVDDSKAREAKAKEPQPGRIRVPHHRLVHSGHLDLSDFMEVSGRPNPETVASIPRHLRLIVELPTIKKSGEIKMEVTSNNVVVEVEGKFYLDMPLPYEVQEANGSAKFHKAKQTLTLELPVVPKMPDPEAVAAAQRLQGLGGLVEEAGEVSDREEEEPELPPLEPEEPGEEPAKELLEEKGEKDEVPRTEEPPSAVSKEEPKRPLLELDGPGASLRVAARPEAEEEPADLSQTVQELEDEPDVSEELPPFLAAEAFEGAKAGYFFGTGIEGLGYYRDLRQRTRRRTERPAPPPSSGYSSGPLVEEVAPPAPIELPPAAQRYLQETDLLATRLAVSDAEVVDEEPKVIARLGRQNLLLRLALPAEEPSAADLRLSLVGRRLTLSFCTRPLPQLDSDSQGGSSSSGWRRRRLRRDLGGAVDLAQSCAEVVSTGTPPKCELQVILRRASTKEVWDAAFAAAPAPEVEAQTREEAEAQALGLAAPPAAPPAALRPPEPVAAAPEAAEAVEILADSAELDVAEPTVQDTTQAPAPRVEATAGAVQSAMVMGQSVLLQNRLMYQLL